jgi:hypothetical protein
MEVTLEAGDILYVPRGWWHNAEALPCTPTFHVAVGVHPIIALDYIKWLAEEVFPNNLAFRETIRKTEGERQLWPLASSPFWRAGTTSVAFTAASATARHLNSKTGLPTGGQRRGRDRRPAVCPWTATQCLKEGQYRTTQQQISTLKRVKLTRPRTNVAVCKPWQCSYSRCQAFRKFFVGYPGCRMVALNVLILQLPTSF